MVLRKLLFIGVVYLFTMQSCGLKTRAHPKVECTSYQLSYQSSSTFLEEKIGGLLQQMNSLQFCVHHLQRRLIIQACCQSAVFLFQQGNCGRCVRQCTVHIRPFSQGILPVVLSLLKTYFQTQKLTKICLALFDLIYQNFYQFSELSFKLL